MRFSFCAASILAMALPLHHLAAQDAIFVPADGSPPTPVVEAGSRAQPQDSPEEIAEDAARDLRESRFYNRPGATRAQYDAAWQECRLIARGSQTPAGSMPTYLNNPAMYNPAISPVAGAAGGLIGGLIAGAIAEGQQRRANRRNCLLIRGWRLVEVPPAEAQRVAAMADPDRSAYLDTIVGAEQVNGIVTERTSFSLSPDPTLRLEAPIALPGTVLVDRRINPAPYAIAAGEAAVIFAFRRPDWSAGRTGEVAFARYNLEARDLDYRPRARPRGDRTTYRTNVISRDRRAQYEVHIVRMTPGDYVIDGHVPGLAPVTNSFCFGAPTFSVGAGQVVYLGDFIPFMDVELSTGQRLSTIAYTSHIEDARQTLAAQQPALAQALVAATLRNGATYACAAVTMDRWDIPGAETLPEPPSAPTTEIAAPPVTPSTE